MSNDIKKQIDELKEKLDTLIENNASYHEIYETSRRIDALINLYLDETQQ